MPNPVIFLVSNPWQLSQFDDLQPACHNKSSRSVFPVRNTVELLLFNEHKDGVYGCTNAALLADGCRPDLLFAVHKGEFPTIDRVMNHGKVLPRKL